MSDRPKTPAADQETVCRRQLADLLKQSPLFFDLTVDEISLPIDKVVAQMLVGK